MFNIHTSLLPDMRSGAVIALKEERLVLRRYEVIAQGCWDNTPIGSVRDGYTLVSKHPPTDCIGGEMVWEKNLPYTHWEMY